MARRASDQEDLMRAAVWNNRGSPDPVDRAVPGGGGAGVGVGGVCGGGPRRAGASRGAGSLFPGGGWMGLVPTPTAGAGGGGESMTTPRHNHQAGRATAMGADVVLSDAA